MRVRINAVQARAAVPCLRRAAAVEGYGHLEEREVEADEGEVLFVCGEGGGG
jgi:hypothetical protein